MKQSEEILSEEKIILHSDGLDTLANIRINSKTVARTDNMFRIWEFDIKRFLVAGENSISVLFESTYPTYGKKKQGALAVDDRNRTSQD